MAKKTVYFLLLSCLFISCSEMQIQRFEGSAFGTYYAVTYKGKMNPTLQPAVDSIINEINNTFSVFNNQSIVSRINNNQEVELNDDFIAVFQKAYQVGNETDGALEMTIGPLVNLWGFGKQKVQNHNVDSLELDSVRQYVGYDKVKIVDGKLLKDDPRIELNFNALAKGYAVDKIADYLVMKGYENVLVDIGGEIVAKGKKYQDQEWNIGLQTPTITRDGEMRSEQSFHLCDRAVATSGNYRNYFEENGQRFTHIINPKTACPERSNLLSVTVITSDCMTADAYATAFMVMGKEKTIQFLKSHPEISVFFVTGENGKFKTEFFELKGVKEEN